MISGGGEIERRAAVIYNLLSILKTTVLNCILATLYSSVTISIVGRPGGSDTKHSIGDVERHREGLYTTMSTSPSQQDLASCEGWSNVSHGIEINLDLLDDPMNVFSMQLAFSCSDLVQGRENMGWSRNKPSARREESLEISKQPKCIP